MKKMKKNRFFLAGLVLVAFWGITSCFSLQSIDSTKPVQIGRITFTDDVYKKNADIVMGTFNSKLGNDPAKLAPVVTDLIEKNYNIFVQAAKKEGITLDVERLYNEFLNPDFPKKFNTTPGRVFEFTVDPQDDVYASCQIELDLNSRNEFIVSTATLIFVKGRSLSKIINVK